MVLVHSAVQVPFLRQIVHSFAHLGGWGAYLGHDLVDGGASVTVLVGTNGVQHLRGEGRNQETRVLKNEGGGPLSVCGW